MEFFIIHAHLQPPFVSRISSFKTKMGIMALFHSWCSLSEFNVAALICLLKTRMFFSFNDSVVDLTQLFFFVIISLPYKVLPKLQVAAKSWASSEQLVSFFSRPKPGNPEEAASR